MSRPQSPALCGGFGFPRVSGDEPSGSYSGKLQPRFSPRERG